LASFTVPVKLRRMNVPKIKICCIQSEDEARMAIAAGASVLGLVSAMPSGPGPIEEARIAEIAATVAPPVETWLLTSLTDPAQIADQWRRCGTTGIQLTDALPPGGIARLRELAPGARLIQVIHVIGEASVAEAVEAARDADTLLLDSGNPTLTVKELGGTGRVHDWNVSREIIRRSPKPVFLAGGLRPDNVRSAVESVAPAGLDLCSGIRTNGDLDPVKLSAFMSAAHGNRF
jgi:phosphoribosylanthranilate isomerase